SSLLRLRGRLLLAGDGLARAATRPRVRARPLASHRERLAVAQAAIRADLLEALDVQRHLAAEISFDGELAVDDLADLGHLGFGEVAHADRMIDARLVEDLTRVRRADAEDVAQRHVNALLARDVDAGDPSHLSP